MKKWIVIMMVMVMIFTLLGCSAQDKNPQTSTDEESSGNDDIQKSEPPTTPAEPNKSSADTSRPKSYLEIKSPLDLAVNFKEMRYSYHSTSSTGRTSTYNLEFHSPEVKTIDGHKAYKIQHKLDEKIIEGWLTEKNDFLEPTINGKTEEVPILAYVGLNASITPFAFILMMHNVLSNETMRTMMGWDILEEGSKTINLGYGNTAVTYYDLESRGGNTAYIETIVVNGKNLIISYIHGDNNGAKNEFNISHLILR